MYLYSVLCSVIEVLFSFSAMSMSVLCSVIFSFLYFPFLVIFFKCSWCILIYECTCFFFVFVVEVLFSFFVFVNFSNVPWFWGKKTVSDWVARNFSSLTVFGENLLADDMHSSVALDRHFQDRQHLLTYLKPTLGICLLTWGLRR